MENEKPIKIEAFYYQISLAKMKDSYQLTNAEYERMQDELGREPAPIVVNDWLHKNGIEEETDYDYYLEDICDTEWPHLLTILNDDCKIELQGPSYHDCVPTVDEVRDYLLAKARSAEQIDAEFKAAQSELRKRI